MKMNWKNSMFASLAAIVLLVTGCGGATADTVTLSREVLLDKIKGGWAGQTFGCTYGGPTEFKYNGTIIPDEYEIPWPDNYIKWWYDNEPGLYDDVYMDLTFVEVYDKYGLDVPVDSMASAFAYASYKLWHANQAARYNILNGMKAPERIIRTPTTSISRSKPTSRDSCRPVCPIPPPKCATASATS